MRVLYVLPSLLIGGAEALVSQWAGYLHPAGHSVEVCTLYTGGPFARRLSAQGVRVHNLNHDPGIEGYRLRRKYDLRLGLSLARLIEAGDYQIVHAHLFPAQLYLAFVSYRVTLPAYLYSEHSVNNRRRRHPIMKPVDRFLYGRYRQILPVSEEVRAALCQWLPELSHKVQVVPNTVNHAADAVSAGELAALRGELGIDPGESVVLYAGRLVPEKGPDLLLEAAARLAQAAPLPVRVLLAGEGPMKAELAARGRSLPLSMRVSCLGNREDIPRLLGLADLVVLPSRWEGLPMFLLESMAAGKAIVASAVGGIPEALEHGVSGWLAPAEDPAALADGMACLLAQKPLRDRLGTNARQAFTAHYSPQVAIEKLLGVYARFAPATGELHGPSSVGGD